MIHDLLLHCVAVGTLSFVIAGFNLAESCVLKQLSIKEFIQVVVSNVSYFYSKSKAIRAVAGFLTED